MEMYMDQTDPYQKLQTADQFRYLLKKTMQFLVPLSLLSFLLSYSSGFSFFFHLSTLPFQLFTHTFQRKYMFLLCNGILAFLVRSLGSTGSPTRSDLHGHLEKSKGDGMKPAPSDNEEPVEDNEAAIEMNVARVEAAPAEEQEEGHLNSEEEDTKNKILISSDEEEKYDEEVEQRGTLIPAASEEEGDELNANTEELNRKFDEFIKKMKEEIRIEAQKQLISVLHKT